MTPSLRRRCLAEALGTMLLVGLGTGTIVAGKNSGDLPLWGLAVAWFAAVAIPIQLFATISGAHLNPAVTMGLVTARRFPGREAPPYAAAQLAGAFAGTLAVWATVGNAAHLGATLPGPTGPIWVLPLEFGSTLLLVGSVVYLTGVRPAPSRVMLLLPAAVVGAATFFIGPSTGSSLNPARSIAPALLSQDVDGLWLYLVATMLAALLAPLLIRHFERHWDTNSRESTGAVKGRDDRRT